MSGTVLYVEDDEANIRLVQRILKLRPGVELTVATTGRAGLELAEQAPPQLILLDRGLPDMSGDDVLQRLKSQPSTAEIPVVMLSGDSAAEHRARFLALGASDFIGKPFVLSELLSVIDSFLES